ncbi:MAG TPA: ribose 5-phosphate isomerase B [Ignavibacteria bacterium]
MIAIGSDHAGYEFKERIKKLLEELGEKYIDFGTHSNESCDYPDYAKKVAQSILNKECTKGILICGTGIGMSIAANRFKGIRAAVCLNEYMAKVSRTHNNSNILAIGERTTPWVEVQRIVKVWLNSEFEGGRHLNRIEKMDQ